MQRNSANEKLMAKLRDLSQRMKKLEEENNNLTAENKKLRETHPRKSSRQPAQGPEPGETLRAVTDAVSSVCGRISRSISPPAQAVHDKASALSRMNSESRDEIKPIIDEITNSSSLLLRFIEDLEIISSTWKTTLQPVDINQVIQNSEGQIRSMLGDGIHLSTFVTPGIPMVNGDIDLIRIMLTALVEESLEMLTSGGRLNIETAHRQLSPDTAVILPPVKSDDYVVLTIRDSGRGISPEELPRYFIPRFAEDRHESRAVGLPLAVGIIKGLGGGINLISKPGRGTIAEVYLPMHVPAEDLVAPAKASQEEAPGGGVKILCIDDEEIVRHVVSEILGKSGYEIHIAGDATEAFSIFKALDYRLDLLITDVIMPGMDGIELAREMKRYQENLKVLFMSGYISDIKISDKDGIIHKPFKSQALLSKIEEILSR